jgi:biotin operon repressor
MNNGFITLHRRILDWQWYSDANVSRVFLHILLSANHKDRKWKTINIKRGQLATSYDSISVKLGLTARQVRTAISKLKKSGECVTRRSGLFLLVTVVKYDDYQNNRVEEVTRSVTRKSPESHENVTRMSINNNVNNDNNVNNVNNIRTMDIKVLKDAYVKNDRLVKAISSNYKMDIPALLKRLDDFNQYLEMTGKFEMDETNYNRYFRNFIKKGKENKFEKYGYLPKNHKDVAY